MTLRRALAAVAASLTLAGIGGGVMLFADVREGLLVTAPTDEPTVAGTVDEPTRSPSPSPTSTPSARPSPSETQTEEATEEPSPEPSGPSYDVEAVQEQLRDLRYYIGPIDGEPGPATTSAVMAFQKVNGIAVDGVVGPQTLAALDDPVTPELRSGPATRIEVDLTRQVAYLVDGGSLARIMPVSSGSGETYRTSGGGTARSLTPVGWFEIERRISGVREAPLGVLYDPLYFYRGWALHGSNSVPAYPASHGCVRFTRSDARWLAAQVPNGTAVHLYGGTHTFTAGSSAPGTDTPAGDAAGASEPSKSPSPEPSPTKTKSPSPEPTPTKTKSPSPEPSPSESPDG